MDKRESRRSGGVDLCRWNVAIFIFRENVTALPAAGIARSKKNAIFIHITTILTFQRYQKNSKTVFIYNTTMH